MGLVTMGRTMGRKTTRVLTAMASAPGRLALALGMLLAAGAAAQAGQPHDWGILFQAPATEIMGQIVWFELYTRILMILVSLFVLALLVIVVVRYRQSRNPTPSTTSHNTLVEVAWTIVPVLILVAIAFPSFRMLYNQTTIPEPDITVKAEGVSWHWEYVYEDEALADIPRIRSTMLSDEQRLERMGAYEGLLPSDVPRLLATNSPLVVPVDAVVHVLTRSQDVNHAFAVPAFGIKTDAIGGRLNETWFQATAPGVYYGQCSELCGQRHAFMPIEVHVLEEGRFEEWAQMVREDRNAALDQLIAWQIERSGAGADEGPLVSMVEQ